MTDIVKVCKIHGELSEENVYISEGFRSYIKKNKTGYKKYEYKYKNTQCKTCKDITCKKRFSEKYQEKEFRDKMNEKHKRYREKNPGLNREWRLKNIDRYRYSCKVIGKKERDQMCDRYIKGLIWHGESYKDKFTPKEIIEVKKLHLMLKRKLRDIKNVDKQC